MTHPSDRELLDRYTRRADQDAFAILVRRHIGFVHSAARRQTRGDGHLADDVTQAVMIVLARKAGTISEGTAIQSWLFSVTRHAAQNAMKTKARQLHHERQAAERQSRKAGEEMASTGNVREVLDVAIARLPELERSGVLLHFFGQQTYEQIGTSLGLSAEAARKRIARALERMRGFLRGRGVTVGSTALVAALQTEATAAAAVVIPESMVYSTINIAMLSSTATAGTAPALIAQGVTRMFALAKLKIAATVALAVTGIAGAAVPLAGLAGNALWRATTTTTVVASTGTLNASAPEQKFVAEVGDDVKVEFLGVTPLPADETTWISIAGEPIEVPEVNSDQPEARAEPAPEHQLLLRVTRPKDAVVQMFIDGAMIASNAQSDTGEESYLIISRFKLQEPADTVSVRLGVARQKWTPIATSQDASQPATLDGGEYGEFVFDPPSPDDLMGGTKVEVHHQRIPVPYQMVAIDADGKEHVSNNINIRQTNDDCTSSFSFELPAEQIKQVRLEARGFDKFIEAKDISLSAEKKTTPQIQVVDAKK